MNITILANRDVHANSAINHLRPILQAHKVSLFLSDKVGAPKSGWSPSSDLKQLSFLEQRLFNEIVSPLAQQQILPGDRFWTFAEMDREFEYCRTLNTINTPEGLEQFAASEPDLVISIRFGKIIKDPVIAIPTYGVINLHSGLLPKYGGILTTLHALNAGETKVGCTLHYIDSAEIDTGAIINSAAMAVDPNRSLLWHVASLYPLGVGMITEAIDTIAQGKSLSHNAQNKEQQEYFGLPEHEHFELLAQRGINVWSAEDVTEIYGQYIDDNSDLINQLIQN